jgi:hypothetical protein
VDSRPESSPERRSKNTEPSLILGEHPRFLFMSNSVAELDRRIDSGLYNSHIWSPEITEQLQGEELYVIDGLSPFYADGFTVDGKRYRYDYSKDIWKSLPERPNRINDAGQVTVIAGDILAQNLSCHPEVYVDPALKDLFGDVGRTFMYLTQTSKLAEMSIVFGSSYAFLNRSKKVDGVFDKVFGKLRKNNDSMSKWAMQRRRLLESGAVGLFAAGAAGASRAMEGLSVSSKDKGLSKVFAAGASATDISILSGLFIKGRTAILYEKFAGYQERQEDSEVKGGLILGSAHLVDYEKIKLDPEYRKRLISDLYTGLGRLTLFLKNERKDITKSDEELMEILFNFLCRAEVFTVNDPGGPDYNPNLKGILQDNTLYQGAYTSPLLLEIKDTAMRNLGITPTSNASRNLS